MGLCPTALLYCMVNCSSLPLPPDENSFFKDFFLSSYSVHKVMDSKAGGKFFETFTFLAVFVANSDKNFCVWEAERNVAQAAGWGLSLVHVYHLCGPSSQVLCIMVLNTHLLGVFKFFFSFENFCNFTFEKKVLFHNFICRVHYYLE